MKFHRMNWFMKLVMPNIRAITLFPFGIYFRDYEFLMSTVKHEEVHWQQQKEMLCLFFYIWYILEWLIKIPFCGKYAYLSISFEQEAYNRTYPRKRFGWIRYIFKRYKR